MKSFPLLALVACLLPVHASDFTGRAGSTWKKTRASGLISPPGTLHESVGTHGDYATGVRRRNGSWRQPAAGPCFLPVFPS